MNMAKYKCKMCGAPLDVSEGQTVITCDFCQSKQTVANANDERKELSSPNSLSVKIFFRNEGEIKTFSGEEKLRKFVLSRLTLKECLKAFLQTDKKV